MTTFVLMHLSNYVKLSFKFSIAIFIDFRNELQMNYDCFPFSSTAAVSHIKSSFFVYYSLFWKRGGAPLIGTVPLLAKYITAALVACPEASSECVARQRDAVSVAALSMSAHNCILSRSGDPC